MYFAFDVAVLSAFAFDLRHFSVTISNGIPPLKPLPPVPDAIVPARFVRARFGVIDLLVLVLLEALSAHGADCPFPSTVAVTATTACSGVTFRLR